MPSDIILPTRKISVMKMFREKNKPRVAYSKRWVILRRTGRMEKDGNCKNNT